MRFFSLIVTVCYMNVVGAQQADSSRADLHHSTSNFGKPKHAVTVKSLIVPVGFITYGIVAINNSNLKQLDYSTQVELSEHHFGFKTHIDDFLQYAPAAAVYGLNALGIKGKNNFRDRTMIYGISYMFQAGFVLSVKRIAKIQRPDGSGPTSFPSGHTTTAFASAEFLRMEYKDVSPWYGIGGYAVAAATGILRMYNNKHWLSDVVAGAGFGILSTKLAYWIYPYVKRKLFKNSPMHGMILPTYQNNSAGLAMLYNFR